MINQLTQFFAQIAPFAITGVIVTAIVQYGKQFLDKTGHKVILLVAASLVVGALAYFFKDIPENFLTAVTGVLASANIIYILFVQWFESPTTPSVVTTSTTEQPPTPSA